MSRFDQTMASPAAPGSLDLWVTVSTHGQPDRQLRISSASISIGRSATCAIQVEHPVVSREHARLQRFGRNAWQLTDLGSHNGTLVNSKQVKSAVVGNGDRISVGPFTLILKTSETMLGVSDDVPVVRGLGQMDAPRLALEQLNRLDDFGRLVLDTADESARRVAVCELLLQPEFGARWAVVVFVPASGAPSPLCPPQAKAGEEPILSRTLIRAVMAANEPMMATNAPTGGLGQSAQIRNIEMSIAPEVTKLTAVAVPLAVSPDGGATLLCAGFPPQYATSEWLALCGLAGRQYRQAETVWTNLASRQKLLQLEADLERARRVQARLVPERCNLPGLDVAIRFRPCYEVGGDYVDILALPGGQALVVIADVSGKGLAAAMVAMGVHTVVHGTVRRWAGLADLAAALDAHLVESLSPETFVTLLAMTIDPASGEVEAVNAGHPPAVVLRAGCEPREVGAAGGFMLGPMSQMLDVQRETLAVDESMLLFTDGCLEVSNSTGDMLGTRGLYGKSVEPVMAAADSHSAADAVVQLLDHWQGDGEPVDDRTLLLLRRRP